MQTHHGGDCKGEDVVCTADTSLGAHDTTQHTGGHVFRKEVCAALTDPCPDAGAQCHHALHGALPPYIDSKHATGFALHVQRDNFELYSLNIVM